MENKDPTRKEIDRDFLRKTLDIAESSLYLKFRAYLMYSIARVVGWVRLGNDNYDGCGISRIWATGKDDPFYHACQIHDQEYSKLKGL